MVATEVAEEHQAVDAHDPGRAGIARQFRQRSCFRERWAEEGRPVVGSRRHGAGHAAIEERRILQPRKAGLTTPGDPRRQARTTTPRR